MSGFWTRTKKSENEKELKVTTKSNIN